MQAQRLVDLADHRRRKLPDAWSEAEYVNGSHLFGLGFGRAGQAGFAGFEQRLEGRFLPW
jgi:hypothetical protein